MNVSDVDPDDTFFELGGTSLMAVRLCQEISNRLGVTLGPWILFQAPTSENADAALSSNTSAEQRSPIVPLKPRGKGHPSHDTRHVRGRDGVARADQQHCL